MAGQNIDLAKVFQAVTNVLAENQEVLNTADDYNHNHGSNMVEIFRTVTDALGEKQGNDAGAALAHAAARLSKASTSGSAQVYREGLQAAAGKFKQKPVTRDNALDLITTLLGSSGAPSKAQPSEAGAGDLLGSLLGAAGGGSTSSGGDLLGSLLGGLGGQGDGLDAGDLLSAGLAFMQSKQSGDTTVEALLDALLSTSQLGSSAHRRSSGKLVANTLMQVLGTLGDN